MDGGVDGDVAVDVDGCVGVDVYADCELNVGVDVGGGGIGGDVDVCV